MIEPGTQVEMTKGYRGVRGMVTQGTESKFEFYVLALENGVQLVAGPSAFMIPEKASTDQE